MRTALVAFTLVLLAATARAEVPEGDLVLRGAALEGELSLTKTSDGLRVTRVVRAKDGSTSSTSGIARVQADLIAVALTPSVGVTQALAALDGSKTTAAPLRAVYRFAQDGSLHGTVVGPQGSSDEVARPARSKAEYFSLLDEDPAFQKLARQDSLAALLDLLGRKDVPASIDQAYAKKAGTPGGGRVLLALDYTRGMNGTPPWREALKSGLKSTLTTEVLTPMLSHFRGALDGKPMFTGDVSFGTPFRDSGLTSAETDQVGHVLCAVETGARAAHYDQHPIEKDVYELGLRVAGSMFSLGVQPSIAEWSRAGIIGHEMIGDEDGSGFAGQMRTYSKLVANGDPDGVRAAWDTAVKSVLAGDHEAAWTAIRKIAKAAEIPETPEEVAANLANPNPRFAKPHEPRQGNSVEDLALSVYGYALGYRSASTGYKTPADARADFAAFLSAGGSQAAAIAQAARDTR